MRNKWVLPPCEYPNPGVDSMAFKWEQQCSERTRTTVLSRYFIQAEADIRYIRLLGVQAASDQPMREGEPSGPAFAGIHI